MSSRRDQLKDNSLDMTLSEMDTATWGELGAIAPKTDEPKEIVYVEVVPENALVPVDDDISVKGFLLTKTGLIPDELQPPTLEDWQRAGSTLVRMGERIQLVIGDWVNYGTGTIHVSNQQIAEAINRDPHTVENYAWVCSSVPHSLRRESLFFGHYSLVAPEKYLPDEKALWLTRAVENRWSVSDMRKAMAEDAKLKKQPKSKSKKISFRADPAGYLNQEMSGYYKKLKNVDSGKRAEVAEILRQWADSIERGG